MINKNILAATFVFLTVSFVYASQPVIFFSDLTSGPKTGGQNNKGVFVTIWGKNFGETKGASYVTIGSSQADSYPEWSDTKVCFQLGPSATTGNIILTTSNGTSNGITFTVRPGNIYFVDPKASTNGTGSYSSPFSHLRYFHDIANPGDTVYIRAGTIIDEYNGHYGWHSIVCPERGGTQASPVAWVAYPGESVTLQATGGPSRWPDNSDRISYIFRAYSSWHTISKLNLNVTGGGNSAVTLGTGWKVVGCDIQEHNATYGVLEGSGDYFTVIGNEIHNCYNDNYANMAHSIYLNGGSLNFEIGWNYLHNNKNQGWEISLFHQGIRQGIIHDNIITNTNNYRLKGILVGDVDRGEDRLTVVNQSVKIYNNILHNVGINGWGGAVQLASGTIYLYNNTIYQCSDIGGTVQLVGGTEPSGQPAYYISNNIIYNSINAKYISNGGGAAPNWSTVTLFNNVYYGAGNGPTQDSSPVNADPKFINVSGGDFHIQSSSAAKDAGTSSVSSIVTTDYDGLSRPQGAAYDIGAYEYVY